MASSEAREQRLWRLIVVGGHTRSIGKTQLVCDVIQAFPRTEWIAGKITQYGHGVCAQNGENCDCAPSEHACALDWERRADTGTDSSRFLAAGARRAFWLRTKQGYLAEGLPLLRRALAEPSAGPGAAGKAGRGRATRAPLDETASTAAERKSFGAPARRRETTRTLVGTGASNLAGAGGRQAMTV